MDGEPTVYLRYGDPPPGGRSARSGRRGGPAHTYEAGVLCFRCRPLPGGGYELDVSASPELAQAFGALSECGRPAYLIKGREIGVGLDGDPLLEVEEAAAPLSLNTVIKSSGHHAAVEEKARTEMRERYEAEKAGGTLKTAAEHRTAGGPAQVLISTVIPHATPFALRSTVHGPSHWGRVADNGVRLAKRTPGADLKTVLLFAVIHDSQRLTDGRDPDHGRRASGVGRELGGKTLSPDKLELLVEGVELHADAHTTDDPTVGCCWDADRLDLPRCGIKPDPAYLSTEAAKGGLVLR